MGDIFSRVSILSGYRENLLADINIPLSGYYGTSDSADSHMTNKKAQQAFGNNLYKVNAGHGAVPKAAMLIDSNGNGISDYCEWLFSD